MLKSRRQFPPGGFHFYESRTNWSPPAMLDFDSTVKLIIQHRKTNPRFASQWSTDFAAVATELDEQTCRQLSTKGLFAQWCTTGAPASFQSGTASQPSAWLSRKLAGVADVGKMITGIGTLIDWLGSGGKAVAAPKSASRGKVCAACPMNQKGDWTRFFTGPASETIKKQLAMKQDLVLSTPYDHELGVCSACSCQLKLKVHTPLEHVTAHLKPEIRSALHPSCWILNESA